MANEKKNVTFHPKIPKSEYVLKIINNSSKTGLYGKSSNNENICS